MTEQSTTAAPSASEPAGSLLPGLVKACRPKQWAKNVLVFVAPAAAGVITDPYKLKLTCLAFVAFCMVSSSTYLLNDVMDVESDRQHPTKRRRPIASGAVPVPVALVASVLLFLGGVALGATDNWALAGIVAGYAVLTTCYSLWLKKLPVFDVVVLSAGFILRLLAGAYAAEVRVSEWFLIISLFGSLFVASAKRYAEKRELGDDAAALRPTLGEYSMEYLGFLRSVSVAAVLVSYCMWALERAGEGGNRVFILLTIVPFLIAILRYALLVDQGKGAAPEDVLLHDRQMQLMGAIWVVCLMLGIYL